MPRIASAVRVSHPADRIQQIVGWLRQVTQPAFDPANLVLLARYTVRDANQVLSGWSA